jgi:methyl halide transferase
MNFQETWQLRYLNQNTPWDKGEPHPEIQSIMEYTIGGDEWLMPGCGHGYDVEIFLKKFLNIKKIVGIDIAPMAVELAKKRWEGEKRVEIREADVFALPEAWAGRFDGVWEHTCFCAIEPERRADYVESLHRVLKPGGVLWGVFYLQPWEDGEDQTQGPPYGTSMEELHGHFEGKFRLAENWVPEKTYPGREGRERMCRWEKLG